MENVISFRGRTPSIHTSVFVDSTARIIGSVRIAERSSVWAGVIMRADEGSIEIGEGTGILEQCFLEGTGRDDLLVGSGTVLSHGALLHGCTVGSRCLIGMRAMVLDGAIIGDGCVLGANTVVLEKAQIPDRSLVLGTPGKVARKVADSELEIIAGYQGAISERAEEYKKMFG